MRPSRLAAVLLVSTLAACVRNPATGKRQISLVSQNQEVAMGQQAKEQVAQSIGLYPDPKLQAYVNGVAQPMAAASERPKLPWSFQVVDDPSVNAFALPGGPIFVTRGILAHLNSEAELAAVLGHEIAHVTARHSAQQISKAQLAQVGLVAGMVIAPELAPLTQAAAAGLQLLFLKHGRDAERQADEFGFKYMLGQNYDPREMVDVFSTLTRVGEAAGAGSRLPEWLATHPNPENRRETAEERIAELSRAVEGLKVERERYLAAIQGIVFGDDPRNGFFRGSTFFHPGLRFQMEFPAGWQTANQTQAVVGVSKQQDAMVGLAAAGNVAPEQAERQFFAQKGVQALQVVGGGALPRNARFFAATTQQGQLGGIVSFFRHGNATFQMLGYTAAGQLSAYAPTFQAFVASFREVSDPAVLNVQPARLELVQLSQDMTLEQFQQRHPSTIPLEQLALINGVDKGGQLKAGQKVKRVTGGSQPPR